MGHIFILCGPPGSGKTTLLEKMAKNGVPITQVQRITTRECRPEEGDDGKANSEYDFLNEDEFRGRLAKGNIANFIEWNSNFYATDLSKIDTALKSPSDFVLHEDMPSAVHLKQQLRSRATIILLFTCGRDELTQLEFAAISRTSRDCIREWKRRLALKFANSMKQKGLSITQEGELNYIDGKMRRALPDLAFMAGKLAAGQDIHVLANRRDELDDTVANFLQIVREVNEGSFVTSKFAFVLMPFGDTPPKDRPSSTGNFDKLYAFAIKPAVEAGGIKCLRGNETSKYRDVFADVIHHIERAEFVIVDISDGNPNVFLELGICLKMDKRILIISRDDDRIVPFNVRNLRRINYRDDADGWGRLHDAIREYHRIIVGEDE